MTRKKRLGRGLEALLSTTADPARADQRTYDDEADLHQTGVAVADRYEVSQQRLHSRPEIVVASSQDDETDEPREYGHHVDPRSRADDHDSNRQPAEGEIVHLRVFDVEDNPFQPRRVFSEPEINSLAESLKEHDILQPILVRVVDGRYQLISGERRLRAAIKANWQTIPARIREADDRLVSELAIVENLQRKDLNPIEKALSFRRYIQEHECTQEGLASRLKIDRSTVANLMRLLELPERIQTSLQTGEISAGHARALLPLGDEKIQNEFCDEIIRDGLSVRAVERTVADKIAAEDSFGISSATRKKRTRDRHIESLQQTLKTALGTKVVIKQGARQKGQIVVHYASHEEFERLQAVLLGDPTAKREAA